MGMINSGTSTFEPGPSPGRTQGTRRSLRLPAGPSLQLEPQRVEPAGLGHSRAVGSPVSARWRPSLSLKEFPKNTEGLCAVLARTCPWAFHQGGEVGDVFLIFPTPAYKFSESEMSLVIQTRVQMRAILSSSFPFLIWMARTPD